MAATPAVASGAAPAMAQPPRRMIRRAIGTRLRRRLSRTFQRDSHERELATLRPPGPGTERANHPAICQSPRIHRERRLVSAV